MSNELAVATSPVRSAALARPRQRSRFFLGMSVVLLLIVLVGFAPTFYLRAFFEVAPIPAYLHVHGALLTGWFVVLIGQTCLIAVRRTDLHRRLAVVGLLLAAGTLITGAMATVSVVPRLLVRFADRGDPWPLVIPRISPLVWYNFASLLAFSVFVTSAIVLRRRPEVHKRLMLLASISIIGPALGRIWRWPIFAGVAEITFVNAALALCLGALVFHDWYFTKRVHPATLIGGGFRILTVIGATLIGTSEFGRTIVTTITRTIVGG